MAIYSLEKDICNKIRDDMKKQSCYSYFAIQGNPASCLSLKDNKVNCLLLSYLNKDNNMNLSLYSAKQSDENTIVINSYSGKNSLWIWAFNLFILMIIIFVLIKLLKRK